MKQILMKILAVVVLAGSMSGCMTVCAVMDHHDELVPLTLPADIVLLPVEYAGARLLDALCD